MDTGELFLLIVRWLHLASAAAWVGGSIFYLLVLRPAIRSTSGSHGPLLSAAGKEFRTLVNACIAILVATGVILAFDRLTEDIVDTTYAVTLGIKSILSVWMFMQVQSERRRSEFLGALATGEEPPPGGWLQATLRPVSGYNALVIIGIVVFLLSDLLKMLFEAALRG
jgi:uncharacterized membrane protein